MRGTPFFLWVSLFRPLSHIAPYRHRKQRCTSCHTCTFNARTRSGKNQTTLPGSPIPSQPRLPTRRCHRRFRSHPSALPASPSYRVTQSAHPSTVTSLSSNQRTDGPSRSSLPVPWKKPSASHVTRSRPSRPLSACMTTNTSGVWRTYLLHG